MVQNATNGLVMSKEPCVSSIFSLLSAGYSYHRLRCIIISDMPPLEHYQAAAHILEGGIFFHGNRASNR